MKYLIITIMLLVLFSCGSKNPNQKSCMGGVLYYGAVMDRWLAPVYQKDTIPKLVLCNEYN